MNDNPGADITVRGGGSGVGITSILEGTCDIADSSRPIKDAELQKAASKGKNIKAHVIAMDGIAVIVNPSNQLSEMSKNRSQTSIPAKYPTGRSSARTQARSL